MSSDDWRRSSDVRYRPTVMGSSTTWQCLGCQKPRPILGSRGMGVRKRCAYCVAAREARN